MQTLPTPPPGGWTLSNLPNDLPKRAELIEGQLVWSAQTVWHALTVAALLRLLESQVPDEYVAMYRMAVKRSERSAPEPDISIMYGDAFDLDKSVLLPSEVLLVGEVISPESEKRDREDKPLLYAAMGIPTFWLVERGPDLAPIVHEHQLYGGAYRLMHTHIGHLKTEIPYPIDIPLEAPKR
jgi:Uma2 family endonuclease